MSLVKTNRINGFDSEPCEVINVTYAELVALMAASSLDLCAVYRITNFQTLHKIPGTSDRNDTNVVIPVEVLLVRPSSTSTLFTSAKSETYPDDVIEYTTDNTAWKDLTISGQKGCITLRIDPIRNIEVGNGDWRNFIVRRWAVDLSAYGRGAIVWKLWAASVTCGVLSTGADQTLTALDTNLYNAVTNPDGYRDFRIFDTTLTTEIENVRIGARNNDDATFPFPNIFLENVAGFAYAGYKFRNIKINSITKCTFTTEVEELTLGDTINCIFTDPISYLNNLSGNFDTSFISKRFFAEGKIGFLLNVTLWENTSDMQGTQGITFFNIVRSYINLTGNEGDFGGRTFAVTLENIACAYCIINKQKANAYILRNFNFNAIINSGSFGTAKNLSAYTTNLKYDPSGNSNIETTLAAIPALALSSGTGATVLDMFAGIINLTGSGTVNIDTLTRFLPNNFPVTLKPASGLKINIATNNVANGFAQTETFTADGTLGEIIILTPVGDRWLASAGNVVGSIAAAKYSATQLDKVANITLADIPNLTANLKAGQAYAFKSKLFIDADAVGGYSIGVNGTAGINNLIWQVDAINNGTNLFTLNSRQTTFVGTGAVGGTSVIAYVSGTIVVSTAGTLKLQFSQSVANGTSSVLVGSSFDVQQLN